MADVRDFLFEIGTEEMPSAPLMNAAKQLDKLVSQALDASGLAHGEIRIVSSPRRLAAIVSDVATETEAVHEVKRGPAVNIAFGEDGAPSKAAEGFARKFGMTAADLVRRVDVDGREYVFAEKEIASVPAEEILSKLCADVLDQLQWPNYRSQRWGTTHETFVRPVRWLCVLLGTDIVPVSFADVISSNTTRGHRVLGPGEHIVPEPSRYEAVLEAAGVLAEDRRRAVIADGIAAIESERDGARVDTPAKVLDEVVNLCEWPTVLVGRFDEEFLNVPSEIICESMLSNQRYFPIYDAQGNLTREFCEWPTVLVGRFDEEFLNVPSEIICESMLSNQRYFPIYDAQGNLTREFVVVSNGRPECADAIIDGNERVVRARLYDAKFFYDEDLKVPLEDFRSRLARVGFQEKLGTVLQKSDRVEKLSAAICGLAGLDDATTADAVRAAHLAKADLVSSAVIEFTSQQGVMGAYYARAAGENEDVALAISDHYRPRFAGDELPRNCAGCVVAVADKLDTIAGMFAIDEPPTGSKDPFALRRAAIGILNILRDELSIGYEELVPAALAAYSEQGLSFDADAVASSIDSFIKGRLEQMARDAKIDPDTVAAVSAGSVSAPADYFALARALGDARDNDADTFENLATAYARASPDTVAAVSAGSVSAPADYFALARALGDARDNDADTFENLATAYARASHLADASLGCDVDESLMGDAELALLKASDEASCAVEASLAAKDYASTIAALAALRAPIDRFFDEVLVMDEDASVRDNRLRLLNRFERVFAGVANIGELARKK